MEFNNIEFGKRVRIYRKLANITQRELATIVDCSDTHIREIELGRNLPSLPLTTEIANALNVGVDQMICGDLQNRTDYFIQELVALTDGLTGKNKVVAMEMVKALIDVLKTFQ